MSSKNYFLGLPPSLPFALAARRFAGVDTLPPSLPSMTAAGFLRGMGHLIRSDTAVVGRFASEFLQGCFGAFLFCLPSLHSSQHGLKFIVGRLSRKWFGGCLERSGQPSFSKNILSHLTFDGCVASAVWSYMWEHNCKGSVRDIMHKPSPSFKELIERRLGVDPTSPHTSVVFPFCEMAHQFVRCVSRFSSRKWRNLSGPHRINSLVSVCGHNAPPVKFNYLYYTIPLGFCKVGDFKCQ